MKQIGESCVFTRSLAPGHSLYPEKLQEYLTDPRRIYYRGDLTLLGTPLLAIVGSRKCTAYGKNVAEGLARRAAELGVTVISGLARGIDSAAQRSVLQAGGRTVAVVATGCDLCYPAENRDLAGRIASDHLLLSEYPDGTEARSFYFPLRNRLISALADAVVIVEAGTRSGSLITAECAAEHGKILYAVPGNITSASSVGTNKLIAESVPPLLVFDDLFREMGIPIRADSLCRELGKEEELVLNCVLPGGEMRIEEIIRRTELTPKTVNGILTVLEMKGLVFCEMGKVMIAK